MFWAVGHLAFAFLTPDWIRLPPENNRGSTEGATESTPHAKQTRAWRFDKGMPTPTANFFSVTRFELMQY